MKRFVLLACVAGVSAAFLPAPAHAAPQAEVLAYDSGDIYVSTPPGAPSTRAVPGGDQPAVSPDGTRLAWSAFTSDGHRHLFVGTVAGGSGMQITTGPADDGTPDWSPDSSRLAFSRLNSHGFSHPALVNADG